MYTSSLMTPIRWLKGTVLLLLLGILSLAAPLYLSDGALVITMADSLALTTLEHQSAPHYRDHETFKLRLKRPVAEKEPSPETEPPPSPPEMLATTGKPTERLLRPIILQAASQHNIDPALVKAIIMAESSYNPRAVSKKGAKGLMQLMPKTAEELGVKDVFDPEANISAGVRYFRQLLDRFQGDVELALAAYNAGSRHVREYQGIPPFKATRAYIRKVLKYYQRYKEQTASV